MKCTLILATALSSLAAQHKAIDVQRSTITIHVGKTGIVSAAGHEHSVNAPVSSGGLVKVKNEVDVDFQMVPRGA